MILFSALENASPWFAMSTLVPVALTGGGASLITILLAYLIDVSSEHARGFRYSLNLFTKTKRSEGFIRWHFAIVL